MQTNANSIHPNANSIHPNPTDIGILAVALRALADFAPALVPAGKDSQAVVSTCPVCIGEPGSLGSLRVEAVDVPKRLSWHCSLHRGGFNGIQYALGKHKAEKQHGGSEVVPVVSSPCTTSDRDPVPGHQKAFRCTAGRWKVQNNQSLGLERSMILRCRKCLPCKNHRKAHRRAQVADRLMGCSACDGAKTRCAGGCAPVRMAPLDSGAYENATRLLRRHKVQYAGVPTAAGRVILTRSALLAGGEVARENLGTVIEELVNSMPEGSKISVSRRGKRAQENKKTTVAWTDSGSTGLNLVEQGAIRARYGCREVMRRGASSGSVATMWSVGHLKPDDLLALHLALGIRIWRGRGNESSTNRGTVDAIAA